MDSENKQPEGLTPSGEISAPFSASRREKLAAFVMYGAALCYVNRLVYEGPYPWYLAVFTLLFVGLTELLHRDRPHSRESWVWLGCLGAVLAAMLLHFDPDRVPGRPATWELHVWNEGQLFLFLHLFAVWWVLCRSGRLVEGESGTLLPLDALHGFLVFPFKHFFLRLRTVWYTLTHWGRSGKKLRSEAMIWTLAAVLLALLLFAAAARLLMAADDRFGAMLERFARIFRIDWDGYTIFRLLLSLPVGAYLFGLIAGTGREEEAALHRRGDGVRRWLAALRRVPALVWIILLGAFCLFYLLFFAVQGSYLFGAFSRTLPEGFIVSQYARQGFFELCKVMAVNFALLWLVTRSAAQRPREAPWLRGLCLALLIESMLFAVIAFSKLALYIDCFGFTPLRLQSTWLVCVLFIGCVCAGFSLLSGKKSFRVWLCFSAVSLALLCLY